MITTNVYQSICLFVCLCPVLIKRLFMRINVTRATFVNPSFMTCVIFLIEDDRGRWVFFPWLTQSSSCIRFSLMMFHVVATVLLQYISSPMTLRSSFCHLFLHSQFAIDVVASQLVYVWYLHGIQLNFSPAVVFLVSILARFFFCNIIVHIIPQTKNE